MSGEPGHEALLIAAQAARQSAYAPYSRFTVGAALLFDDGIVITGSNAENASYGLSLCAETVAVAQALAAGRRGGLTAVAIAGGPLGQAGGPITPCGRCRQVLHELAALGGTDPMVISTSLAMPLSQLLPQAFGPASLG